MRYFATALLTFAGAVLAFALTVGLAAPASAEPSAVVTTGTVATVPEPAPVTQAEPIRMPPGDTLELRAGVGAGIGVVIGGLAGLPFFGVGAIPGMIIGGLLGAGIGALSWNIANAYLGQG
ncbi:hypothetical protein ACQPW1_47610 [Nocardia sp. CA-128927]|uniref:hypothetical protein n=1 Tax=Nocardia sp. CA-128927 TaxID=3239975 RepID=UPI003D977AE7